MSRLSSWLNSSGQRKSVGDLTVTCGGALFGASHRTRLPSVTSPERRADLKVGTTEPGRTSGRLRGADLQAGPDAISCHVVPTFRSAGLSYLPVT